MLFFEWQSLQLKHRLSQGVVFCLSWFFPVPFLWRPPIPLKCGMMNAIWICGSVVCLLFCLLRAIKRWEPTFWRHNCSHVWVPVPGIKLITIFFSQYNPNLALKYDFYEKGHYFTVRISYFEAKIILDQNVSVWVSLYADHIDIFQFIQKNVFTAIHVLKIESLKRIIVIATS